ncbi:Uncharacterized protein BP5553_04594 [Venustampulla echinocandica]|uniref:DUF1996 domain-containing protein n=1 Tax=Venustampulla echinocandica TaxID=2656787 RepID=A0A370TNR8_9HELO|nr:Uncharacterized protein BP5553_04594 [Venustampulla echinocandica]RDL37161.1 Uncharacterized protein BP5553_04594 [Venustampulla echinocandica]
MDPSDDPGERSTCTTSTFVDDFSNYWTPVMYYRASNGTYKRVRQLGALFHEEARGGGITIYYSAHQNFTDTVAFKKGFRMRNGDPNVRTAEEASKYRGIDYTCMLDEGTRFTNRSATFPDHQCPAGILTTIYFPPCWDGVNLDSPDHYSHVAWPAEGGDVGIGALCPATHPVKIPQIIYEIRWDTRRYNVGGKGGLWPEDGSQPFVWSFGDNVGYGNHGDYLFGWKGDSLDKAFKQKNCVDQICGLDTQEIPDANKCMINPMVDEPVEGWLDRLPGMEV